MEYRIADLASITSNPLFINVAESMVGFAPVNRFGCFEASLLVMLAFHRVFCHGKAPAGSCYNRILDRFIVFSVSNIGKQLNAHYVTGIKRHPFCFASSVTICPAATKVLFISNSDIFLRF